MSLHRSVALCALVALLHSPPSGGDTEGSLSLGIRQFEEGDFTSALVSLDDAARQFAGEGGRTTEHARALLYMGAAYVGLGEEALARRRFLAALALNGDIAMDADRFPAKCIRLFEQARSQHRETQGLTRQKNSRRGRTALLVAGVGAVGSVAVALTAARERSNHPPTAAISITPETPLLNTLSPVTLTASANDEDGDALVLEWDLGDGTRAAGSTVTHTYHLEPVWSRTQPISQQEVAVQLRVSDGRDTAVARRTIRVKNLSGRWSLSSGDVLGLREFHVEHGGEPGFACWPDGSLQAFCFNTLVRADRSIAFSWRFSDAVGCHTDVTFSGTLDGELDGVAGTFSCRTCTAGRAARCSAGTFQMRR